MKSHVIAIAASLQFKLRLTRLPLAVVPHMPSNGGSLRPTVDANSHAPNFPITKKRLDEHVLEFLIQLLIPHTLRDRYYF
jgi:hypothetical protein